MRLNDFKFHLLVQGMIIFVGYWNLEGNKTKIPSFFILSYKGKMMTNVGTHHSNPRHITIMTTKLKLTQQICSFVSFFFELCLAQQPIANGYACVRVIRGTHSPRNIRFSHHSGNFFFFFF